MPVYVACGLQASDCTPAAHVQPEIEVSSQKMEDSPGAMPTPVIFADDEELIRIGFRHVSRPFSHEWTVSGESANIAETIRLAEEMKPEIAIVDEFLPSDSGSGSRDEVFDLCRRLSADGIAVIVYLESSGIRTDRLFERAGAVATAGKCQPVSRLVDAIRSVRTGQPLFTTNGPARPARSSGRSLSLRQKEVVRLLALGKSNFEIALEYGVSVRTVESHRARIRSRIGADSISAITRFAVENDLL